MEELRELQNLPLNEKIQKSKTRIVEFYNEYDGNIYISFSGGKDSTVLRDIIHSIYQDVPAVFADTGLEYPEVRSFALSHPDVTAVYPQMWDRNMRKYVRCSFRQVLEKYGYPVISKEQSAFIQEYRETTSEKLRNIRWNGNKSGRGKISDKWKYLVNAPFRISDKCCDVMKKNPCKLYEHETGRHPIIGTMAVESKQRESNWLIYGCNSFEKDRPTSNPISFWTEQDILRYLKETNIPYASVYGEIIEGDDGKLHATGCERTGCMFCMFGAQCDKSPTRFQRLKETHPKQYSYCMKPWEDGGLGLAEVLDYIGVEYK